MNYLWITDKLLWIIYELLMNYYWEKMIMIEMIEKKMKKQRALILFTNCSFLSEIS